MQSCLEGWDFFVLCGIVIKIVMVMDKVQAFKDWMVSKGAWASYVRNWYGSAGMHGVDDILCSSDAVYVWLGVTDCVRYVYYGFYWDMSVEGDVYWSVLNDEWLRMLSVGLV